MVPGAAARPDALLFVAIPLLEPLASGADPSLFFPLLLPSLPPHSLPKSRVEARGPQGELPASTDSASPPGLWCPSCDQASLCLTVLVPLPVFCCQQTSLCMIHVSWQQHCNPVPLELGFLLPWFGCPLAKEEEGKPFAFCYQLMALSVFRVEGPFQFLRWEWAVRTFYTFACSVIRFCSLVSRRWLVVSTINFCL